MASRRGGLHVVIVIEVREEYRFFLWVVVGRSM